MWYQRLILRLILRMAFNDDMLSIYETNAQIFSGHKHAHNGELFGKTHFKTIELVNDIAWNMAQCVMLYLYSHLL